MSPGLLRQFVVSATSVMFLMLAGNAYTFLEPLTLRLTTDPEVGLSAAQVSWLVAAVELGCVFGPLPATVLADRYGRKPVIMGLPQLFAFGWLLVVTSMSLWTLFPARFIHGLAQGATLTVLPTYMSEIVEPGRRINLFSTFRGVTYAGVFFSFVLGPFLNFDQFAFICLLLPLLLFVLFNFCPESPYYLLKVDEDEKAREVLLSLRDSPDVEEELATIKYTVKEATGHLDFLRTLIWDKGERKSFLVVQTISITNVLTGMPVVLNYAVEIFSKTVSFQEAETASIVFAVTLTSIGVLSAFLPNRLGRKPLLLISCFGCFLSHFLTGLYFFLFEMTRRAKTYNWVLYLGLVLYSVFSIIGLGSLMQTLQSERFGAHNRGTGGCLTDSFGALLTFGILKAYHPLSEAYGVYINFWLYGGVGLVAGLLFFCFLYQA